MRPLLLVAKARNKYGEIVRSLKGVIYRAEAIITRVHTWTISQMPLAESREVILSRSGELPQVLRPESGAGLVGGAPLEYCQ